MTICAVMLDSNDKSTSESCCLSLRSMRSTSAASSCRQPRAPHPVHQASHCLRLAVCCTGSERSQCREGFHMCSELDRLCRRTNPTQGLQWHSVHSKRGARREGTFSKRPQPRRVECRRSYEHCRISLLHNNRSVLQLAARNLNPCSQCVHREPHLATCLHAWHPASCMHCQRVCWCTLC